MTIKGYTKKIIIYKYISKLKVRLLCCFFYELFMVNVKSCFIVSTGSIRWILWFSVRYAAATSAHREIFGVDTRRGKQQQLGSPNFSGYLHWGVSFSGKENSLILKNKMAATGISLKIIYIFLLAVPHR